MFANFLIYSHFSFFGGPQLEVLKDYFWFCTEDLFLAGLGDHMESQD